MNPRAAINDLHPFQGCPFSHLGYFSMHRMYALRIILMSIKVDADICRIFTAVYSIILSWRRYLQRRGWDSNPRALADKRFSRPPRYDHFDTSPNVLFNSTVYPTICQALFSTFSKKVFEGGKMSPSGPIHQPSLYLMIRPYPVYPDTALLRTP